MLFNSIEFIIFFVVVTTLYFYLPHKYRWFMLLMASCYFYMAFVPIYIVILFATIIIDYFAGIYIQKSSGLLKKSFLILSLVANIGILFVFKYYNFFIDNVNELCSVNIPFLKILLPIGLSFHTFQAMSYTIEVYRGNQVAERHFGVYSLYVMFYPQLVAGPIERPQNLLHQFREEKRFEYENMVNGLKLMAWGMFKKVVVADKIAVYVNSVFNNYGQFEGVPVIIACLLFSFQIYLDFSGYSDIAIGTAKTMGFHLMTNFNRPYQAKSITEFWSRWHISLSTWFRDYLYIPLGGNRKSKFRTTLNQFVVFIVSGFWHGANWTFLLWGFIHGFFVSINNRFNVLRKTSLPRFIKQLFVFLLVSFAWIFFRAESLKKAIEIISSIFCNVFRQILSIVSNSNLARMKILYANTSAMTLFFPLVFLTFVLFIEHRQKNRTIPEYFNSLPSFQRNFIYLFLIYSCVCFGAGDNSQFIYFQF